MAELQDMLSAYVGTVETGAVVGWKALWRRFPGAKITVVRRKVDDVIRSFANLGIASTELEDELRQRDAMLATLSKMPGVTTVEFGDLRRMVVCQRIFERCLGLPFDWEWWESLAEVNVQVDVAAELRYLDANRARIEAFKREALSDERPIITVAQERWSDVRDEIEELFAGHFAEVDGGIEPRRRYKLDHAAMAAIDEAGCLEITAARIDGALVGYCMWMTSQDVESEGLSIAQHGPWYVSEKYAHLRLGLKLFDRSIDHLREVGVSNAFPHHRLEGRGKALGAFYARRGAQEIQHTYSLWLDHA